MPSKRHKQLQTTLVAPVNALPGDELNKLVFISAVNGSVDSLCKLIECGVSVDITDQNGLTPLHYAASRGCALTVLVLICLGAERAIVAGEVGTPLHIAAVFGHVSTVKTMLKLGCPVDVVDSFGRSVLHSAAQGGSVEVIREVLSAGCNVNVTDNNGETPLHKAAEKGNIQAALELISQGAEKAVVAVGKCGTPLDQAAVHGYTIMVKAMLKAGCPVSTVASNGCTVLHAAANGGNVEMIKELLSAGCDINATDDDGDTPLHVAAISGNTETALELIRLGAEKAIVAGAKGTPLHRAAKHGHVTLVKKMLKVGCPVDVLASNGRSVLHFAAESGNSSVIREVLSTGFDINATDNDGMTPLHLAGMSGNNETALELIKNGAEKAIAAGEFGTPLHRAALHGHISTLRLMLEAGCPVDAVDKHGGNFLHFAAQGGNAEMIREALTTGCDINAAANDGDTPLHVAAVKGNTETVLELIRCGADKAIVAGAKGTALHQAAGFGHLSTVKAMLKAGCPIRVDSNGVSVLHAAAEGGNAEMIRVMLSTGCDINALDKGGKNPLHVAAICGNTETALELIRHGAEKAAIAGACGTPLHQAVMRGHTSTVKAMLKAGCPVDVVDSNGASALHAAAGFGFVEVIGELLGRACDVNATDSEGCTPLDYAASWGKTETVLNLVRHGADKTIRAGTLGGPLLSAACCGHWSTVEVMLGENFPVDGIVRDGETLLHLAAIGGNVRLLRTLVERGFNVSQRDYYGLTPLHYAIVLQRDECFMALLALGANTKAEAPLLGTPLNTARLYYRRTMELVLGGTVPLLRRRPDEMIVDFALCKELGINIQSPYLFSEHGGTISVFEGVLFSDLGIKNKVRTPKHLRKVLSVFSRHRLVNLNKLACLAAIHGDVAVLECLSEILTARTGPGKYYGRLKQLFTAHFGRRDESILMQVLPECELNPLHLAVISMMCAKQLYHVCMEYSSRKYTEVIDFLTTNDSFRYTLNECLPNGLSPLDLAEKLRLDEAVTIITGAGGRQGVWAIITEEIRLQHGTAVLHLHQGLMELRSAGPLGQQAVQAILGQLLGRTTTAEQGTATEESHLHQQKVLEQRPDLSIISTYVIAHVNVERWRRLGISLKIPLAALTHISSIHSSCEDRYLEVLIYWLEHNEAASWRTLLEVLGHFETKHTMDQLTRDILGTQDSEVPPTSLTQRIPYHLCPVDTGPTPSSSQLSPQLVSVIVHHVGVNWYNFALHLGISSTVLDVIKVERRNLTSDCCRESLHCWLRQDRDTGREKREEGVVLEAIRKTCGPVAVEQIQLSLQGGEDQPSSPTPLLQSTPELAALQEHVVPFTAAQWEAVADYLQVSYEKRAAIAASEQGRVEECCRELFNQWLQQLPGTGSLPRTWGKVLDVVGEAVGPEVAKQIRARLDSKQRVTPTPSSLADPLRDELLSSKPTAVLLLKKVVPSVAHKWHQLGVHLGMNVAILKTFKVTESHDVKLCCLEMFECWLEGSRGTGESPRTWSTVLSAVGDCLGCDVADSIERALLEERRQRKQ